MSQPDAVRARAGSRLPDFFIVGQPKSGTSSLYAMLKRQPQVFMPDCKEPWFFADELHVRAPPRPEGIPATLEQYAELFAPARAEQRVGEATAFYLWSQTAAAHIAQVRPDAKIVAILREPASLLRSLHLQFVETYIEVENDLAAALALEGERRAGRRIPRHTYWPQALLYSDHVRYVEQLRRYSERFPPEQMLVLVYDDFREDNAATVANVLRFLGVEQERDVTPLQINPTVRARSQRLNALVHAVSVGRGPMSLGAKAVIKALTPQQLRRRMLSETKQRLVFGAPEPPDEALMSALRARFRGEVELLSEYLGRDLITLWGYDELR